MKKITNVIWSKDGVEKFMQFDSRTKAKKAAFNSLFWPNEIPHYPGMSIALLNKQVMNHIEVWQSEQYVSLREINWEYYIAQIEAALKVDLGMCAEAEDGHCLDSAYDAFLADIPINDYVKGVRA